MYTHLYLFLLTDGDTKMLAPLSQITHLPMQELSKQTQSLPVDLDQLIPIVWASQVAQ